MNNTIFYSWQSDLPNTSNRNFIEQCLIDVVKQISNIGPFSIDLTIDRDTKNELGTPDIINTILKKIDHSKMFIADISIINFDSSGRKTPNPNVLFELGYAVRSLGWEKVICLYNLDYGSIEELPFDLRQRRPLTYSLKTKSKQQVRKEITSVISKTIIQLNSSGSLFDIVDDYLKVQVDTEILTCINHLYKILLGYPSPKSLDKISIFLRYSKSEVERLLSEKEFIGFQIFKKFEVNEQNLQRIADKVISSSYHGKEIAAVIIELVRWIGGFDNFCRSRTSPELFCYMDLENSNYKVITGRELNNRNSDFPDRFILLEKIDDEHGKVIDFGDFIERDKIEGLLKVFSLNKRYLELYTAKIMDFIAIANKWLDHTNGEFIIENNKMFELKPAGKIGHSI